MYKECKAKKNALSVIVTTMEKDNKTIKKLPCTRSYARVRPSCLDPSALSTMKEGKKKEKKKTVFSRACAGKQRPVAEIHSNSRAASCNTHDEKKKNSNK